MFRMVVACVLPGLLVMSAGSVRSADKPRTPNVILIVADDLGGRDLGCYGSTYHKTPHLDALAAAGAKFTHYYAACPVCSPTRSSIMTGKYPVRTGITDWLPGRADRADQRLLRPKLNNQLALEETTVAEVLKGAGYVTGHIGKWHLGGEGFGPKQQGFDSNIAGDAAGSPISYFAPFENKKRSMPGLENAPKGEYLTDRLTDEAVKFIQSNQAKPFFLYLAHFTPHTPLQGKPELVAKYKGTPTGGRQSNPIYAAMLESLDEGVGRIMKTLNELKLTDDTIVIFTSDNGGLATIEGPNTPATANGPFREGKGHLYEGGIRDPLIIRWKELAKPGTVIEQPACSIDLFPTIVDAIKSTDKPDRHGPVDGWSLTPVIRGEALKSRPLFWHYPHYSNQGGKPGSAVRLGDYKLIEFHEDGRRELFNLKKDPSESRNLIADEPAVAKELADKLTGWKRESGALMPAPNPDFVPNPQNKDGTIVMHARTARVHGIQLRFEPLPHKNTLGFWTKPDDWAEFECTVSHGGTFAVEMLQGCGKGSGGSEVEVSFARSAVGAKTADPLGKLSFTVKDTGGFQAFEPIEIGKVTLEQPGRYTVAVRPKKKPGVAVMDLRQITLKPVAGK